MNQCKINCSKLTLIFGAILICIYFTFSYKYYYFPMETRNQYVYINVSKVIFETDEKYLSVALDMSFMSKFFNKLNTSNLEMLANFSRLLSPAYIRLGGTAADQVLFKLNETTDKTKNDCGSDDCEYYGAKEILSPKDYLNISGYNWLRFNKFFVDKSSLKLLLDLNVLLRNGSEWDSKNAQSLLAFCDAYNMHMDFQLGNEPNSFSHVFNVTINGHQLAKDFKKLREILNAFELFKNSKLVGPDVTRPRNFGESSLNYLKDFLTGLANVNAVSWHQYYFNGAIAKSEDFLNPLIFDVLYVQINDIKNVVQSFSSDIPIWMTETSSAYGGGAPGLSDRFIASFIWVDKLGLAAKMGMKIVMRQSLFKGYYALIDDKFMPLPDYWISLFYKILVGTKVLPVNFDRGKVIRHLRLYGHCLKFNPSIEGNIVLFGMNLSNKTERVIPGGLTIRKPVIPLIFTPENEDLTSKIVLLNGERLEFFEEQDMYLKKYLKPSNQKIPLSIPPYSIAFWIIFSENEGVCKIT